MLPLPLSSVDERGTEERGLSAASQPRKRRRADKVGVSSGHLEEGRERGEYAEDKGGGKYSYCAGSSFASRYEMSS